MESRKELAKCLRRQLVTRIEGAEAKALPPPVLEWFRELAVDSSDDELITAHLFCDDCGEKLLTLREVDSILKELRPTGSDQFLDLVYQLGHHHPLSAEEACAVGLADEILHRLRARGDQRTQR